jgi:hypothetical protein
VNPGSVGLARGPGGEACYAVFARDRVTLKRVPYDVEHAVGLLRRAPLQKSVIDGLVALLNGRGPRVATAGA